jgi:hypothetical protein
MSSSRSPRDRQSLDLQIHKTCMVFALQGLTPEQLASYFGGIQYYDPSAGGDAEISIEMMQQMHVRIFLHVGGVAALQGQGG